jgi:hypothetical protein
MDYFVDDFYDFIMDAVEAQRVRADYNKKANELVWEEEQDG